MSADPNFFSPPVILGIGLAAGWLMDKMGGAIVEHHTRKLFIQKDEPKSYVEKMVARIAEMELEHTEYVTLLEQTIAERDHYCLSYYEQKRQVETLRQAIARQKALLGLWTPIVRLWGAGGRPPKFPREN